MFFTKELVKSPTLFNMAENKWELPNQFRIMREFMKVNYKVRTKTNAFWGMIVLSFLMCFAIKLLSRFEAEDMYPYNKPYFWKTSELNLIEMMPIFHNSLIISPITSYTHFIANILLPDPNNRTIYLLSSDDNVEEKQKMYSIQLIGLSFEEATNDSLKNIKCKSYHDIEQDISVNAISLFLFKTTMPFIGHNVTVSVQDDNIASPYKPTKFGSGPLAIIVGISFVFLVIRSFLHMIELKEHKLFLLLTISGSNESTIWCAQFLIDLILILFYSIFCWLYYQYIICFFPNTLLFCNDVHYAEWYINLHAIALYYFFDYQS